MLTEEQIKKELFNSEYLWRLQNGSRQYSKEYWQAGYSMALRVVLGLEKSKVINDIKELTNFEMLSKIMNGGTDNDIQN